MPILTHSYRVPPFGRSLSSRRCSDSHSQRPSKPSPPYELCENSMRWSVRPQLGQALGFTSLPDATARATRFRARSASGVSSRRDLRRFPVAVTPVACEVWRLAFCHRSAGVIARSNRRVSLSVHGAPAPLDCALCTGPKGPGAR